MPHPAGRYAVLLLAALGLAHDAGRDEIRWRAAGAALLLASILLWGVLVAPVNAEWRAIIRSGAEALPPAYARLRVRWESGDAAAFAAWLAGYCVLLAAELRATSRARAAR